jgi:hypothetical protein
VRVACDPWVRAHAKALGVMAVMLDEVYAAADVQKVHPTRLNAFASPQTGPLAALVEDRIVPMSLPVRDAIEAARAKIGKPSSGTAQPIALFWMSLDEPGRLIEAMLGAPDRLGYRGAVLAAMGGGHTPERMTDIAVRLAAAMPTVVSPRAGGGPMLRQTYGGPSSEIALRKAGLIWGGRLHPLKARGCWKPASGPVLPAPPSPTSSTPSVSIGNCARGLSHVAISVVSTGARSAERRDLASTISGLIGDRRSLRAALRALVETMGGATCIAPALRSG